MVEINKDEIRSQNLIPNKRMSIMEILKPAIQDGSKIAY